MTQRLLYDGGNSARSQLASGIDDSQVEITVKTGQGELFPNPGQGEVFFATLENAAGTVREVVKCTKRVDDTLTVERGADGSTAQSFAADDVLEMRLNDGFFDYFLQKYEFWDQLNQEDLVYGIRWNQATDTIAQGIVANGVFVETDYTQFPVQARCVRTLHDQAGSTTQLLDPENSAYLSDGATEADVTGNSGDFQTRVPSHYQLWTRDGDDIYILVSMSQFSFNGDLAYVPLCLQGKNYYFHDCFESVKQDAVDGLVQGTGSQGFDTANDVFRSLPGYKPWSDETRSIYRAGYANRGGGTHQELWSAYQMMVALYITKYADWDSQTQIPGYTEAPSWDYALARQTGRTLSLGNSDGSITVDFSGEDSDLAPSLAGGGSDWVESTTTPGEFYYTGDALLGYEPPEVLLNGTEMTKGTLGSLAEGEYAWGDNDTIGSDTLYVRLTADADPDTLDADALVAHLVATGTVVANSFLGIENFFGHLWKFVDGINIDNREGDCHVYVCHDPANLADDTTIDYVDTGIAPGFGDDDGYISDIYGQGQHAPLYPAAINGSSSTYVCDYHYNDAGAWRVLRVGGDLSRDANAGAVSLAAIYASGDRSAYIASRGAAVADS